MTNKTESKHQGFAYARWLLEERRKKLRELEQPTHGHAGSCFSCRRSLEQAISELEALLQTEDRSIKTNATP